MMEVQQHIENKTPRESHTKRATRRMPHRTRQHSVPLIVLLPLFMTTHTLWKTHVVERYAHPYVRPETITFTNKTEIQLHLHTTSLVDIQQQRHQIGTWVGNWWFPPPEWKLFTPQEMLNIYSNLTMLWIGDSTARRTSMNLYKILDKASHFTIPGEHENVTTRLDITMEEMEQEIDLNKGINITEPCNISDAFWICRDMPHSNGQHDFLLAPAFCLGEVQAFLDQQIEYAMNATSNVHVIVISMGVWESVRPVFCQKQNQNRTQDEQQDSVMESIHRFLTLRPDVKIIWRTSGWYDGLRRSPFNRFIRIMERNMMDKMDAYLELHPSMRHQFSYVNWAGAIATRSFGNERIRGDIKAHYGLEPRLVLIQMITNRLNEMIQWSHALTRNIQNGFSEENRLEPTEIVPFSFRKWLPFHLST
jgi:hypothetical protein